MRRIVIVGVVAGVAFLIVRARGRPLHERLMARCEAMFDRMPDDFPPKRMVRGIDEIRGTTARILELLEREDVVHQPQVSPSSSTEGMRDTA
jgi:hypothetical protein